MLLHFTRVDDVMCFKHLSVLFMVHQEIVGSKGEKENLAKQNGEIAFQFGSHQVL